MLAPESIYADAEHNRRQLAELGVLIDQAEDRVSLLRDRATLAAAEQGKNDIARKALVGILLDNDDDYAAALANLYSLRREQALRQAALDNAKATIRRGECWAWLANTEQRTPAPF